MYYILIWLLCTGKIYLYVEDPHEPKYQFFIKKRNCEDLKHCNDSKTLTEYSNAINDIYEYIEEYNPNKERQNIDGNWWYDRWFD